MSAREALRNKLKSIQPLQIMGAHNGLGAKLIEKHQFDGVWASGFEISAACGKPDANILTMNEFLEAAKQMVDSTSLPVIADCDTGFGDINNVVRMVKEYEKIGVAAVCIEDKVFPKTNSFIDGRQKLESAESFAQKIYAAQKVKEDPHFMIIARIEALIAGEGMDKALERAHTYKKAGADMILIHSKQKTPDEVFEFCRLWDGQTPVAIVPTTYPDVTLDRLAENNINMVIYANQVLRAAVKAMDEVLHQLKQSGNLMAISSRLTSMEHIFDLQGMNELIAFEKEVKQATASIC